MVLAPCCNAMVFVAVVFPRHLWWTERPMLCWGDVTWHVPLRSVLPLTRIAFSLSTPACAWLPVLVLGAPGIRPTVWGTGELPQYGARESSHSMGRKQIVTWGSGYVRTAEDPMSDGQTAPAPGSCPGSPLSRRTGLCAAAVTEAMPARLRLPERFRYIAPSSVLPTRLLEVERGLCCITSSIPRSRLQLLKEKGP